MLDRKYGVGMTEQIFGRKWFPDESDFIESQEARTCRGTSDAASPRPFHRAGVRQVRQYWLIRPLSARYNGGRWPFRKRAQQCRSSRGMHPTHLPLPILLILPSVLRLSSAISTLVCRFHRSNYCTAILIPTSGHFVVISTASRSAEYTDLIWKFFSAVSPFSFLTDVRIRKFR